MLIDTDVLIWYLRGNSRAKKAIEKADPLVISSVTYMEILQGFGNKSELKLWKVFLKEKDATVISIDEQITSKAIFWMEEYGLSHNLKMADALIAATSDIFQIDILTGNYKDYKFLPGLTVKKFKEK